MQLTHKPKELRIDLTAPGNPVTAEQLLHYFQLQLQEDNGGFWFLVAYNSSIPNHQIIVNIPTYQVKTGKGDQNTELCLYKQETPHSVSELIWKLKSTDMEEIAKLTAKLLKKFSTYKKWKNSWLEKYNGEFCSLELPL